jgi:hypothetical protein
MEDYQENMRRAFRLIEYELSLSNHALPSQRSAANINVDEWMNRISQIANEMYSPAEDTTPTVGVQEPSYSFNNSPPLARSNGRRGFIYTQLLEPRDNSDSGITAEQIENSTQIMQYDPSMNETRCPITWDQFESGQTVLRINNCGHIFGQPALMQWFQRHSRCPVCRASAIQNNPTTSSTQSTPAINLQTTAQMNISDRVSSRRPFSSEGGGGNAHDSSNTINQLISGILTGVNSAVNTENGYYESEFSFNMDDLLSAYTQLLGTQSSVNQSNTSDPS